MVGKDICNVFHAKHNNIKTRYTATYKLLIAETETKKKHVLIAEKRTSMDALLDWISTFQNSDRYSNLWN